MKVGQTSLHGWNMCLLIKRFQHLSMQSHDWVQLMFGFRYESCILYIFSIIQGSKNNACSLQMLDYLSLTLQCKQWRSTLFKSQCTETGLCVTGFRSHTCSVDPDACNALKQYFAGKLHAWNASCHLQIGNAAMLCPSRQMHQHKHTSRSHNNMLAWANLLMQSKHH